MSVSSVSQNQDHSARNAAIAGSVGLVGGGALGYATKSILKDGNYTDEFVNSVSNQLLKYSEWKTDFKLFSLDEKSPTFLDDLVKILKENPKIIGFEPEDVRKESGNLLEMFGGEKIVRSWYKRYVSRMNNDLFDNKLTLGKNTNFKEMMKKYITPVALDDVFDKTEKTFKTEILEDSKDMLEFAKKALKEVKLKSAALYGGIAGLALGLGTYIYSKTSNK